MQGGEAFWSRSESELDQSGRSWLISEFECSADWSSWEMHPHGEEFVYLIAGEVLLQLQGVRYALPLPLSRADVL